MPPAQPAFDFAEETEDTRSSAVRGAEWAATLKLLRHVWPIQLVRNRHRPPGLIADSRKNFRSLHVLFI
jgi:hypothetical protein